mmetsp:Transcript_84748/g.203176  ORF Transcript_84748/g.203176 Transcript_84748/m.203176 type:complete len:232 (+) Transcript_84748:53-748(+)
MEPMYVAALEPEPLYITVRDGRIQTTAARDKLSGSLGKFRDGRCLDTRGTSSNRTTSTTSASSRSSSTESTAYSGTAESDEVSSRPSLFSQCTRILWCEGNAEKRCEQMQALGLAATHFGSPSNFTRWYFEQVSGAVADPEILVAGWREAKPCAAAIKASITGNTEGLRNDCKRPLVRPMHDVLVRVMIILAENPKQAKKATEWIQSEELLSRFITCRVVLSLPELVAVLS